MPLKIGNYGNWEGGRPGNRPGSGYHPHACTCYTCNEGRRRRRQASNRAGSPPGPNSSPRTPTTRSQPAASVSASGQGRDKTHYPATQTRHRRSRSAGAWWWCLALILVVVVAAVVALSTLSGTEMFQGAGDWLRDFDRTASYQVTDPQGDPYPSTNPVAQPPPVDPLVEVRTTAMSLVNEARAEHGLSPLETSDQLVQIATDHSEDMAARGYFAHDSPDGETYLDRYHAAGFYCQLRTGWVIHQGAENLYKGWASSGLTIRNWKIVNVEVANAQGLAMEAVEGWMQSPGHRANILNDVWRQQGIGVAVSQSDRVYLTQSFC